MARNSSARAPKGTVSGTCRDSRPCDAPGTEWVRPYKRAQRMLDHAADHIMQSVQTVIDAGRCYRSPIRSTMTLVRALGQVTVAAKQHTQARHFLDQATEAFEHTPPELRDPEAAELLEEAAERCQTVEHYLAVAANEVILGQTEIVNGVESGEVVLEDPRDLLPDGRPRPRITPDRLLFVRAFLAARQRRVAERITPELRRRRQIPLPAEVRVPRRNLLGRAPPLSSTCPL